jgi:hypothetical protein
MVARLAIADDEVGFVRSGVVDGHGFADMCVALFPCAERPDHGRAIGLPSGPDRLW